MAPPRYAELRCRSCFSFLEGGSHPEELVARAEELGLSALALGDRNGLYGVVRGYAEARRRGYPLIVGAELAVADLGRGRPGWLTLLAIDREGYANLCRLITAAHGAEVAGGAAGGGVVGGVAGLAGDGRTGAPPVRREKAAVQVPLRTLGERARGLFALHAGVDAEEAARLRELFGHRLALTVTRHHVAGDEARATAARTVGARLRIPVAVVNDVHTHARRRQVLQDVLACVRMGVTVEKAGRRLFPNAERTLKGPEEMARLWPDFPEGLEAAAAIADECAFRLDEIRGEHPLPPVLVERSALAGGAASSTSSPGQAVRSVAQQATSRLRTTAPTTHQPLHQPPIPTPTPKPHVSGMTLLRELVKEGARWRYGGDPPDDVARQLEKELELVDRLGYASYFLTVWDVVRFARERGILCQGRGSAANSAVCYVLGVTSIDPVRMGLLFERFISAERGEPPDIDVDFEHERREEVLQYVYERYGRDHAGMVCEVITYRTRSALRDVGKALGLSLGQVDRLTKLVSSHDDPATIADATLAQRRPRPARGAAGAPGARARPGAAGLPAPPLHPLGRLRGDRAGRSARRSPSSRPPCRGGPSSSGTRTTSPSSTSSRWTSWRWGCSPPCRAASPCWRAPAGAGPPTPVRLPDSLATIPAEDPAVYEMAGRADTIGVFQIESRAQMGLLPRLKPRCFYDLVISVAIIRPGPIQGGMVHPFLRRRDGLEPVVYPYAPLRAGAGAHPRRAALPGAGHAPGDGGGRLHAGRGRRAAARHDPPALPREAGGHEGAAGGRHGRAAASRARRPSRSSSSSLGFADYGFPESHAASFALLVYASAWLKRYHPAVFAAALLNGQPMGFYAPHTIVEDAKRHGVAVRGIDVQASGWESTLEGGAPGRPAGPGEAPVLRRRPPRGAGPAPRGGRGGGGGAAAGPLRLGGGAHPAGRALPRLGHPARRGRGARRAGAGAAGRGLEEPGPAGPQGRTGRPLRRAGAGRAGGGARALQRRRAGAGRLRHHRPLGARPPHGVVRPALAGGLVRTVRELSGSTTARRWRWPGW